VKLLFNDPLPCDAPAEQAVQMALELRTAFAAPIQRLVEPGSCPGVCCRN
jgi:hypothetical protein